MCCVPTKMWQSSMDRSIDRTNSSHEPLIGLGLVWKKGSLFHTSLFRGCVFAPTKQHLSICGGRGWAEPSISHEKIGQTPLPKRPGETQKPPLQHVLLTWHGLDCLPHASQILLILPSNIVITPASTIIMKNLREIRPKGQ